MVGIFSKIEKFIQLNYYDTIIQNNVVITKKMYFQFEYFLYIRFYLMYLFFYYLKHNEFLLYSFFLQMQFHIGKLCCQFQDKYLIEQKNNNDFLDKASHYVLLYLFLLEIYFHPMIHSVKKIFLIGLTFGFKIGNIINKLFRKRIHCIKEKKEFEDPLEFLFLMPKMEDIYNTYFKTKYLLDENLYLFINVLLFLLY